MDYYLNLTEIKKIVIKSLFANDFLYDCLVLKGGTALEILGFNQRASRDIDFSMEGSFEKGDLENIKESIEKSLKSTFNEKGLDVIDLKLSESPTKMSAKKEKYWGGYDLEFKITDSKDYNLFEKGEIKIDDLRRRSKTIDSSSQKRKFQVDISRYEFCENKKMMELDGYQIYIYSPLMIVYEKLRAICQQDRSYKESEGVNISSRARDFFDIHSILEDNHYSYLYEKTIEKDNLEIIKEMFKLKKVPINNLALINKSREFHRETFTEVKDTATNHDNIETFDYYFDYVVRLAREILRSINN